MVALRHSLPILICLLKQHYRITGAQSTYDARIQFTFRNLFSDYSQITFPEIFPRDSMQDTIQSNSFLHVHFDAKVSLQLYNKPFCGITSTNDTLFVSLRLFVTTTSKEGMYQNTKNCSLSCKSRIVLNTRHANHQDSNTPDVCVGSQAKLDT